MTASHLSTRQFSYRAAKIITEVFAPVPSGLVVVAFIAWHFAATRSEAIRGATLGVVLALLLPFSYLLRQVRKGRITDHHVGLRTQRPRILLVFFLGVLATLTMLIAVGSPPELIALIGASLVGLVVALTITFFWKISIHAGVAAGISTVFVILFGPWMLLIAPLVLAVAWARVRLGDHTATQVVAGTLIGALISGLAFSLFMMTLL
ncbi:MAG: phosphoesterase PA-phosphatase [Thermomicrobia bacterium]|nr:phosphoesterase PA-phosphatase [Thermomicrobia bacterium]